MDQSKKIEQLEVLLPTENSPNDLQTTQDFFLKPRDEQIKDVVSVINSSLSVSFGILLTFLNITINFKFAGSIDDQYITGGIGLCVSVLNCLALFLTFGLNQGCGSLAARALGSNSVELMKNYYNKGIFTIFVIICYVCFLSLILEQLLVLIGQDPNISHYAWVYFTGIIPGLACMFLFDLIRVIFNSMGMFNEPMYMQFFSLVIQYICCWIFVSNGGYGFKGIILSTNISYVSMLLMIIYFAKKKQIDIKPNLDLQLILKNYKGYITFCLHIALPTVIDSFCFEFNAILLGSLQIVSQFNAHVVYSNLSGLVFSISLGVGGALCTLISNAVGENNEVKAKNYFKISYIVIGLQTFICTIIFCFFGDDIAYFYTSNDEVAHQFLKVLHLHIYFLFFDYLQGAQAGIMKAIGEGRQCIKYFIISFYLVGNSLSVTFGVFLGYGIIGFWGALCVGIMVIFILQTRFLLKLPWKQQISHQFENLMKDKKELEQQSSSTDMII